MAGRNYEAPDLRVISDGILGGVDIDESQTTPVNAANLSYEVWKDVTGASGASYQDYVAWMNKHGYGAYIQDEQY